MINICKNLRLIRYAAPLERHGGSSGRPEAARGLKSRFMTGLKSPVGPHLTTRAVWKALKRPLEEVLDAHCLKSRFLKDVFNKITTFGGSVEPENHSETVHNPCLEP